MCKAYLNNAYKHYKIREENYKLQVFFWGGWYFMQIRLILTVVRKGKPIRGNWRLGLGEWCWTFTMTRCHGNEPFHWQ